jgi:hypothetical protein
MQDDISTTGIGRSGQKTKKSTNGKWVSRQDAEMDNEAATPSTLAANTSSTPTLNDEPVSGSSGRGEGGDLMGNVRTAFDGVVSRGSDILSKVDLSRGTGMIRDYPIQAAVGGLIVGFLVGAAVFSRRE